MWNECAGPSWRTSYAFYIHPSIRFALPFQPTKGIEWCAVRNCFYWLSCFLVCFSTLQWVEAAAASCPDPSTRTRRITTANTLRRRTAATATALEQADSSRSEQRTKMKQIRSIWRQPAPSQTNLLYYPKFNPPNNRVSTTTTKGQCFLSSYKKKTLKEQRWWPTMAMLSHLKQRRFCSTRRTTRPSPHQAEP